MLGSHCINTHSQTQDTIALSLGEPEFYGIVEASTLCIGIKSLMEDLGLLVEVQVNTNSSAARRNTSRKSAGRVRHVEVQELWIQEKVQRGELSIIKVRGEDNVADGLTKHVDLSKLEKYMNECGYTFRDGRHDLCPYLADV